jgi:starch phosphorylase
MFKQVLRNGYQGEVPDIWLDAGNPWEVRRPDVRFKVGFGGRTETVKGVTTWIPSESVSCVGE